MSWTAPTLRTTGELITASNWNTDLVNNLLYLKDVADAVNTGIIQMMGGLQATPFTNTAMTSGSAIGAFIPSPMLWSVNCALLKGTFKFGAMLSVEGAYTASLDLVNVTDAPNTAIATITCASGSTGEWQLSGGLTLPSTGTKVFALKPRISSAGYGYAWLASMAKVA